MVVKCYVVVVKKITNKIALIQLQKNPILLMKMKECAFFFLIMNIV